MRRLMPNVEREAEERYWQLVREMSPSTRLELTAFLTGLRRERLEDDVREAHPRAGETEIRRRVFELMYARDFTPEQLREWERRLGLLDAEPEA